MILHLEAFGRVFEMAFRKEEQDEEPTPSEVRHELGFHMPSLDLEDIEEETSEDLNPL